MVLGIVLTAELIALLLATARLSVPAHFWDDLARTSFFLLWIALCSAGALCRLRPALARLGVERGSALALALLLAVTALFSQVAWWAASSGFDLSLGDSLPGGGHAAFLFGNLAICLIVGGTVLRYFYVTDQWRRNVEGEARARIDALQARIRPHFLYNSMNTIASLTRSNPIQAERAVEDLADLFRANLSEARNVVRLAEEVEIARTYERIEQLRLGTRLRVDWRLGELPDDAPVPGMFLQPLLENAIYHGIERLPGGGTVTIAGSMDGTMTEIRMENPLPSLAAGSVRPGNRIALANLRERLALLYAGAAALETDEQANRFVVRLRFPSRTAAGARVNDPVTPLSVLVVDDEAPARERLVRLLDEIPGTRLAAEAATGRAALERAAELRPDVVLLDVRMPEMDGVETARHLALLPAAPAVVFTTAYDEYALAAFEAQAIGYLLKPVRREARASWRPR